MIKILIIDTETASGFKPKNATWWGSPELLPKLAQLSFIKCSIELKDDKYVIIENTYQEFDYIIKPEDTTGEYEVENSEIHRITTEIAKEKGVNINIALQLLIDEAQDCDFIIGHNLYFDTENILAAGQLNNVSEGNKGMLYKVLAKEKRIDAMQPMAKICKIPFPSGRKGNKFPRLEELYTFLFNEAAPDGLHNSLEDVKVTMKCVLEVINRRYIDKFNDIFPIKIIDNEHNINDKQPF